MMLINIMRSFFLVRTKLFFSNHGYFDKLNLSRDIREIILSWNTLKNGKYTSVVLNVKYKKMLARIG